MISIEKLTESMIAFVELKGMGPERERLAIAAVRQIALEVHKLLRHEVIQAKAEAHRTE